MTLPVKALRTRFAPSPTGYLHLGHVASALFVWGLGRRAGAEVWLRIEDHDQGRVRQQYVDQIVSDLAWLGFEPDNQPYLQSSQLERYEKAWEFLAANYDVYACSCSRKTMLAAMPEETFNELRYQGTCRHRRLPPEGHGLRLVLPREVVEFDDWLCGYQQQVPAEQCGDLLLRDRHGHWTYQFAVVVDDWHDGIDLVIRGQDLLRSTGRQCQLRSMLGVTGDVTWAHHGLIVDDMGKKLAKRNFSQGIIEWRQQGFTPAQVLGQAAYCVGLIPEPRDLTQRDIEGLFDG